MRRQLRVAIALTGLLWSAICLVTVNAAIAEPKRVLLLNSFGRDFASYGAFATGFRAELDRKSPEILEFFDAALMTERFGGGQNERPFVDYLQALFAKRPLDLITAIGAPAARFVQQHRSQLFPSTPMLFAAVDQRRVEVTALTANDTVVAVSTDFASVVKNILLVLPETTDIVVVVGNSPNEQYWLEQIRRAVQPYTTKIAFTWLNDLSFDEVLKRTATLPPKSAIFFYQLSVDGAGHSHEAGKAWARLRAVANAPIFTSIDTNFGNEIVGGPLMSVNDVAQQTAGVAMRILNGEAPSDIKSPPIGHGTPKFDWRELQRWNISESRLPPGSEISFRNLTLWEQYWWELHAAFAAVLLQSALIGWLLLERRRRHFAELESRGRLREVIHLDRVAAVGAMSASIAHELNQPLGAILANAETAEMLLAASPLDRDQLKEILADIRQSDQRAAEIIAHLRGLLKKQGEAELQAFDLNDAIRDALHTLEPEARKRGVLVSAHQAQGALPVLADQVHLEQVILNLAANAMDAMQDCAPGTRVMTVQTALAGESAVEVSVSDSGTGIPNDQLKGVFETFYTTKQQGTGLGLSIVRTIVENCGGKIWAENRPGGGAIFRFTLPLTEVHPA